MLPETIAVPNSHRFNHALLSNRSAGGSEAHGTTEQDHQATGSAVRWAVVTVPDGNHRLIPLGAGGPDDKH
jgi:hypothetical protein